MKIFLIHLLLSLAGTSLAQTLSGDSTLASERSIDRPIILHARQFRITGSYDLSVITRRFDNDGKTIELRDEGLASVRHRLMLDLKYGLHDLVQVNVSIAQSSNVVREQSRFVFSSEPAPVISQDIVREYSGLEDLYLGLDLRAPLRTRKVDLAVALGFTLAVASNEPAQPEHSFHPGEENGLAVHKFVYRYRNPLGKGVPVATIGGMVKFRTAKWAISARANYQHGLSDGESFEWRHQLNEDAGFDYRRDPFSYRLADSYSYFTEFEYQPLSWFDLFLNLSGYNSFHGWDSPRPDLKVSQPFESALVVAPGFEIIVTPRLWLRERISFSPAGKNHEAPFSFQTSLMYNFFPFK